MLLRDADGDGKAELTTIFAQGFDRPHGLAFMMAISMSPMSTGSGAWPGKPAIPSPHMPPEPVTPAGVFGAARAHWTRNIVFSPDGKRFIVTVGSADNIGEDPPVRATLQSFAADGSDQRTLPRACAIRWGSPIGRAATISMSWSTSATGWAMGWCPIT